MGAESRDRTSAFFTGREAAPPVVDIHKPFDGSPGAAEGPDRKTRLGSPAPTATLDGWAAPDCGSGTQLLPKSELLKRVAPPAPGRSPATPWGVAIAYSIWVSLG